LAPPSTDSPSGRAVARAAAGLAVPLADLRRDVDPHLRARAAAAGIELRTGTAVVDTAGRAGVYGAMLADVGGGVAALQSCDVVCMSGGWSPAVHLTSHTGIKPRYRADIAAFVPGGFASGPFGAGALVGSFGFVDAVREGVEAGCRAAVHAGFATPVSELPLPDPDPVGRAIEPVWEVAPGRGGKAFVD